MLGQGARIRSEHPDALSGFEELVSRQGGKAHMFARKVLGNWHDVEDVVQEAYLRAICASSGFRQSAALSTWFCRIVYNLCHDRLRQTPRQPVSLGGEIPAASAMDPQEILKSKDLAVRVQRAVDGLPQRQRLVIVLHRYDQLSHEDISLQTGWSVSAVESLLVRAYQRLRKELADLE